MRHAISFVSLCVLAGSASAQSYYERARTWEFGFDLVELGSYSSSGEEGSSLNVGSELGFGLSGGYNFNNHVAIQFDYSHISPSYDATFRIEDTDQLQTISYTMDVDTLLVRGTYYFLAGEITPYIDVGAGWSRVDSNVATGPPTTGCWWDPWWGYICSNFYNTYHQTDTVYTGAVGIRWDMSPSFMLRGDYGTLMVDTKKADVDPDTIRVGFRWRF